MVNIAPRKLYPRERATVPVLQEVVWAPKLVWTCAKDFAPTGFRPPDRPSPCKTLNLLRYPGPLHSDTETDIPMVLYWINSTGCCLLSHARCAKAIFCNRRAITVKARVPFQARYCDTCGGQSGKRTGIFASALAFPCQYHSTITPHSFSHPHRLYGGPNLATNNTVCFRQ